MPGVQRKREHVLGLGVVSGVIVVAHAGWPSPSSSTEYVMYTFSDHRLINLAHSSAGAEGPKP